MRFIIGIILIVTGIFMLLFFAVKSIGEEDRNPNPPMTKIIDGGGSYNSVYYSTYKTSDGRTYDVFQNSHGSLQVIPVK